MTNFIIIVVISPVTFPQVSQSRVSTLVHWSKHNNNSIVWFDFVCQVFLFLWGRGAFSFFYFSFDSGWGWLGSKKLSIVSHRCNKVYISKPKKWVEQLTAIFYDFFYVSKCQTWLSVRLFHQFCVVSKLIIIHKKI